MPRLHSRGPAGLPAGLPGALLGVLLGALALLVAPGSGAASAAQCVAATSTVADAVGAADAVVTVKVTKRIRPAGGSPVHYRARVLSRFKGSAPATIQVVTQPNSCHLASLAVGTTYLLFLRDRHTTWLAPADLPSSANVAALQPQVEAAMAPPTVTFGEPQAGAPKSLRRVAAPGLALVIIGLLGLLFVRRAPRAQA